MHSAESLGEPTAAQRDTFILNLHDLFTLTANTMIVNDDMEAQIFLEGDDETMVLSLHEVWFNNFAQGITLYTEIYITPGEAEVSRLLDAEPQLFASTNNPIPELTMSNEVANYQESIETLHATVPQSKATIEARFDDATRALYRDFSRLNSLEVQHYIGLTDRLIQRYVIGRHDWPTNN